MTILNLTSKRLKQILDYSIDERYSLYKKYYGESVLNIDKNNNSSQKILYSGNIYKVIIEKDEENENTNISSSYDLDNCLILVKEDISPNDFIWKNITINSQLVFQNKLYENAYVISPNGDGIISNSIIVILSAEDLVKAKYDPNFIINDEYTNGEVKIPDTIYNQILNPVGVPFISEDELEYTHSQILELIIKPTLITYFTYNPIVEKREYTIKNNSYNKFLVDDPYNEIVGLLHCSIIQSPYRTSSSLSPFYTQTQIINSSNLTGSYTNTNDIYNVVRYQREVAQGMINREAYFTYSLQRDRDNNKYLVVNTNKIGSIEATFRLNLYSWDYVSESEYHNFIKYGQGLTKKVFGNLRQHIKNEHINDYKSWPKEGEDMCNEVLKEWYKLSNKYALIR